MTAEIKYPEPFPARTPDVMTRKEASRYLRLDLRTFDRLCRDFRVPRFDTGHKILFRRVDVDALFKAPVE
ncbi:MAG: helix-turn-helix domain-containing protein [Thermoguttaceae bacterium]|nr:helix-turn-helix domain-containing protein [Thermoguttaceae bacterium]